MTGDPLREAIEREMVVEREGWAPERAARVTERLLATLPTPEPRFETVVIWTEDHGAFTGPGRTIYISRRLLERLPDDDATAFVIAHELAHHRLGHIPSLSGVWWRLPVGIALARLERTIAGPEREGDADLLAIEMCADAGYDPDRCVAALGHLAQVALDYGDVDGVIGPDAGGARLLWWSRRNSHPALADRVTAVRAHLAAYRRGARISLDVTRVREARRKRVALAAAGGVAATIVLALLRRRP